MSRLAGMPSHRRGPIARLRRQVGWDLIQFARLSGCDDLVEQAGWTAEQYERRVVTAGGGRYPVVALQKSFAKYLSADQAAPGEEA